MVGLPCQLKGETEGKLLVKLIGNLTPNTLWLYLTLSLSMALPLSLMVSFLKVSFQIHPSVHVWGKDTSR